jgi:hypothetical protein
MLTLTAIINNKSKTKTHEKKKQKSSYSILTYLLRQQRRNPTITDQFIEEFVTWKTNNYYLDKF